MTQANQKLSLEDIDKLWVRVDELVAKSETLFVVDRDLRDIFGEEYSSKYACPHRIPPKRSQYIKQELMQHLTPFRESKTGLPKIFLLPTHREWEGIKSTIVQNAGETISVPLDSTNP